jgi:hypothetical protein
MISPFGFPEFEVSTVTAVFIRWRVLGTMAALFLAGCGLEEYEQKMVREQKKREVLEEQVKYLGEPAEITIKAEPGSTPPPVDIFFRMPKGVEPKPAGNWGDLYSQYPKSPTPPRQRGMPPPQESPFMDVLIGVAPPGDWKQFTDRAQQPFQGMKHGEFTRAPKTPPGRSTPLDFQTATFTETGHFPTAYILYLHQSPQARVAIAFHMLSDRTTTAEVTKAIDQCLQTLAIGPDAAAARQQFQP